MNDLNQLLESAARHLSVSQPDEADKACRMVLEKIPGQPDASHMLAYALLKKSQTLSNEAIQQVRNALGVNPDNLLLLATLGETYLSTGMLREAEGVLKQALIKDPDHYYSLLVLGKALIQYERYSEAERVLRKALSQKQVASHDATYISLSKALMPGDSYHEWLVRFHQWLQPATYLEIGVQTGQTLRFAQPPTVAVGVDPNPILQYPLSDTTQMFNLESDVFFAQHDLAEVMGHAKLDLAFIDGLHVYDQVLRDFMNVERFSHPGTVVVLHDVRPLDNISSDPVSHSNFNSGDAWKVMAALRRYRPDLTCFTIPTAPTGLGIITNLDSENTVLKEHYNEIISTYQNKNYDWLMKEGLSEALGMFVNDWEQVSTRIGEAHAKHYE